MELIFICAETRFEKNKKEAVKNYHADNEENILMAKVKSAKQRKDEGPLQILIDVVPSNIIFAFGSNSLMLQIIFFSIFFIL